MKTKIPHGTSVKIHSTRDVELDGKQCEVIGIANEYPEFCMYIVKFPCLTSLLSNGYGSLVISEYCLDIIGE